MNIKDKFKDFKARLSDRHMYSIVLVITALIACAGIYQYKRSIDFRDQVERGYQRAFTELTHYVNNLDNTLTKVTLTASPSHLRQLAADLWRYSAFAQANLGQLPVAHTELDNTANFLSQVGDYTYSLSKKMDRGETLSEKELTQLDELSVYALELNGKLQNMQSEMFAGVLRFDSLKKIGSRLAGSDVAVFSTSMEEIENGFSEYAALIYDGPFSQHLQNKESVMLKGRAEVSQDEAITAVKEFIGSKKIKSVEPTGEGNGNIPTYNFSIAFTEDGREAYAEVTKRGGYVMMLLDGKSPSEAAIDVKEAAAKAHEFLRSKGYHGMTESYYQRESNTVVVNFAYKQENFVVYSDLIKVKVSLENGEIIGFEAHGYLTNHIENREIPEIAATEEQARLAVRQNVTIDKVNFAVIPLETGGEAFCYELKSTLKDRNFLVYVNVTNGEEERLLLLLENEDGTLTI